MMKARPLCPGVDWVGSIDFERRLFDSLMPLPKGTSYNAYLVRGSAQTALIDSVDPAHQSILFERLESAKVERLDFIVCQHAEQDHSGAIPALLERYPEALVLCTPRCQQMLADLLDVPRERTRAVGDGETLSLGGATLEFVHFPWVHWPETMLTYLPEQKLLFSGDLFGAHLATAELFVRDAALAVLEAKRYFAELMMPFRSIIAKNFGKVEARPSAFIAPSHGPVWDSPQVILEPYREWTSGAPHNLLGILHVSMHDSTKKMVDYLLEAALQVGVRVEPVDLAEAELGRITSLFVDAGTLVFGTPTVLGGPHPKVAYAAFLAGALKPRAKCLSVIGTYGWGGKAAEQLLAMVEASRFEVLPPVLGRGLPRAPEFAELERLARAIATRHTELGLR